MRVEFSLEPYFNTFKYMPCFYNSLIKINNLKKKELFKELNISTSSYFRSTSSSSKAIEEVFSKLEAYFNINKLDNSRLSFYNAVLTETIIKFYYKQSNSNNLEVKIQECIDDHNYLYPVFILLKKLLLISNIDLLQKLDSEATKAYKELYCYKDLFCIYPTVELFEYLAISTCNPIMLNYIPEFVIAYDFKGLIYNAIGINAYQNQRYDLALYYIHKSYKSLLRMYNYKRLLILNITYFATLNSIREYDTTITEAERQLIYLSDTKDIDYIKNATKIHYYNALMAKDYFSDILNSTATSYINNPIDFIYRIIASKKIDYNTYLSLKSNTSLISSFRVKNEYIYNIIDFLENKNEESLASIKSNLVLRNLLIEKFS